MHEAFLKEYLLKKDESIEKVQVEDSLHVMTVVKKTARTYKKVAQVKITASTVVPNEAPEKLNTYHFTPKVKRQLKETNDVIQQWLREGWIVREVCYNPDGISVKEEHYRIGPAFVMANQQREKAREADFTSQMQTLFERAERLKLPSIFKDAIVWERLPDKWSNKKRMKYVEFCLAFYELSQQKDLFDFKEIGATLQDAIGGSKYFDADRDAFLKQLESSGIDASFSGLVSIGKIVPIYFTGNMRNAFSTYSIGAVHATTDNAVLLSPFSTTNTTLWLVENRAILTRMALEIEFLQQTNSCIVCLDGQIRSAHRSFIEQLLKSNIEQTIIWTDTDVAGVTITKHASELVTGPVKIVGRDFKVYHSFESYADAHHLHAHEQEQQLGGVKEWMNLV